MLADHAVDLLQWSVYDSRDETAMNSLIHPLGVAQQAVAQKTAKFVSLDVKLESIYRLTFLSLKTTQFTISESG